MRWKEIDMISQRGEGPRRGRRGGRSTLTEGGPTPSGISSINRLDSERPLLQQKHRIRHRRLPSGQIFRYSPSSLSEIPLAYVRQPRVRSNDKEQSWGWYHNRDQTPRTRRNNLKYLLRNAFDGVHRPPTTGASYSTWYPVCPIWRPSAHIKSLNVRTSGDGSESAVFESLERTWSESNAIHGKGEFRRRLPSERLMRCRRLPWSWTAADPPRIPPSSRRSKYSNNSNLNVWTSSSGGSGHGVSFISSQHRQ